MIAAACIENTDVSNITVRENGKSACVSNPGRQLHRKVQVDKCVCGEGRMADWAIERGDDAIIIELKGRDVERGATQILATAQRWKVEEARCQRIAGLIVGRQTPGASTRMQIMRAEFTRRFGGPLHVVNSNCSYQFEALFSFKGPHKL